MASCHADSQWIQFYETSGEAEKSFYMANHGMVLQSLIRNYVNDYWGRLEIASCPVFAGKVAFGNIRTKLGITVSGEAAKGVIRAELLAERGCENEINGMKTDFKEGEKYTIAGESGDIAFLEPAAE